MKTTIPVFLLLTFIVGSPLNLIPQTDVTTTPTCSCAASFLCTTDDASQLSRYLDCAVLMLEMDSIECAMHQLDFANWTWLNNNPEIVSQHSASDLFGEVLKTIESSDLTNNPELHFHSGCFKSHMGDYEKSIKDFEICISKNIYALDSHYSLGCAQQGFGRYKESIEQFTKCIEIEPHSIYFNNRGFSYLLDEQFELAITDFKEVLNHPQTDQLVYALALNNLGFCLLETDQLVEAKESFDAAISITPENSYIYRNLAFYYYKLDMNPECCASIQKAIDLNYLISFGDDILQLKSSVCED